MRSTIDLRPASRAIAALALLASLAGCGLLEADDGRPRLILLISVDTLRADHLGVYGGDADLTPHLDALAAESQVFEAAYAPSSFTLPSVSALLTGRHPSQLAVYSNQHRVPRDVVTLAEALRGAGYRTGAVVSNFALRRKTGVGRGFEFYDDRYPQEEASRSMPERVAAATTEDALAMLRHLEASGDGRIFLWVHYQDPHGPYTPPGRLVDGLLERERGRPGGRERLPFGKDHTGLDGIPDYQRIGDHDEVGFYRARYAAEVRYADEQIGRLLDGAASRGLLDDALVVFVADHGESLGEGDYWFAHGEYLSDPLVRVPLLIRTPARQPTRRTDAASILDLVPTVLAAASVERPEGVAGRDLLARGAESDASTVYLASLGSSTVPRVGIVRGGYKYVVTLDPAGRVTAQVLHAVGDEATDLSEIDPERTSAMRAELAAIRRSMNVEGFARVGRLGDAMLQELTPEEVEMLERLGYVGGPAHTAPER